MTTNNNSLNLATLAGVAFEANKDLAKSAAFLEAGRITNNKLIALVAPKLPIMVRGYAQTPVGKIVMANMLLIGVQKFRPDNQLLAKLAYASVTQAYAESFEALDIEGMLDSFLKDTAVSKALGLVERADIPTAAAAE